MGMVIATPGEKVCAADAVGEEGTVLPPGPDGEEGVATGKPIGGCGVSGDDSGDSPGNASPIGLGGNGRGGEFVGTSDA